jgi:hypothetical protein
VPIGFEESEREGAARVGFGSTRERDEAILIGCADIENRSRRCVVEEGTPEHFFTNPTHERTKSFLSKIL